MEYTLHKASPKDIDEVLRVTREARAYQQRTGNPQWRDGYPSRETVARDIASGGAVVLRRGAHIVGYAVEVERDEGYRTAWTWPSETDNWCVIHRLALDDSCRGQGIAQQFLAALIAQSSCEEIRIDTGAENPAMQHIAQKLGFERLGEAVFPWGSRIVLRLKKRA